MKPRASFQNKIKNPNRSLDRMIAVTSGAVAIFPHPYSQTNKQTNIKKHAQQTLYL